MKFFTPSPATTRKLLAVVPNDARQRRGASGSKLRQILTRKLQPQRRVARFMSVASDRVEGPAEHPPVRVRKTDQAEISERLALYLSTLADRAAAGGQPIQLASTRGFDQDLLRELRERLGLSRTAQDAVGDLARAYCDWVRDEHDGHYNAPWGRIDVSDEVVMVAEREVAEGKARADLPVPRLAEVARPLSSVGARSRRSDAALGPRASSPPAHGRATRPPARRHA